MKMNNIFNSTFEISLRVLLILDCSEDSYYSSDMLAAIDFISVYGHDFGIGVTNLHGDNLFKYSEFATRRELVKEAIKKLVLQGLISANCQKDGFTYSITNVGINYCNSLKSDYANSYRDVAYSAIELAKNKSQKELLKIINEHSLRSILKGEN